MQVQLVVANEQRKGQVIPVNVPSFMIGRAEGSNLRSRSATVSRFHCVINIENGTVMVQDLGGGNGTYINGARLSSAAQTLKDNDQLVIGSHAFVVAIKAAGAETTAKPDEHFELLTSVIDPVKQEQSETRPIDPAKATVIIEAAKSQQPEAEVMFEIRLKGSRMSVTKSKLFELARKGSVLPDDLVTVAGTKVFADSIQGIVFGESSPANAAPLAGAGSMESSVQSPSPAAATSGSSDPFAFPDLGNMGADSNPFDHVATEPYVKITRHESAFSALWKALDISFSRVYSIEGNSLVIHSIKALYYVLVVTCFLAVVFMVIEFSTAWYKSGVFLEELQRHFFGLASTFFGGVTIIVIVRVLLEMLLLAWFESAKEEQKTNNGDN